MFVLLGFLAICAFSGGRRYARDQQLSARAGHDRPLLKSP